MAVNDRIRRYLYAVEQDIPKQLRSDITNELRSLIEDQLEDRAQTRGQPVDMTLVDNVLRDLGAPDEVARRYNPAPRYLVGPRFYSDFMRLIKIGLVVLAVLVLFMTVLNELQSTERSAGFWSLGVFVRAASLYYRIGMILFAWAVIVLAILERTMSECSMRSREWHPRDLPEVPDDTRDRIHVGGMAVGICLIILFGAVLNLSPEWMSVLMVSNGRFDFVPITDFGVSLPTLMINIWLALALLLKMIVLSRRSWTRPMRWAEAGLGIYGAYVLFRVASGSVLVAPDSVPQLEGVLRLLGRLLYVVPLVALIEPIKQIVRLVRRDSHFDSGSE
jgi:hypothetical protein